MTTAQHPRALFTPRRIIVSILVLGWVLTIAVNPDATKVEASGLFGGLRSPGDAAFIAAHRGDRTEAPENTMPALQAAIDGPLGFVETDVQLTSDGVPVLMHDTRVDRTTNGSGRVSEHTLDELLELDAGAWFSPAFTGTRVPTLDEFFLALGESARSGVSKTALLELKGYWSLDEVRIVTDLIAQHHLARLVILSSFDPVTMQNAQEAAVDIPRAILTTTLPPDPVAFTKLYGAIALIASHETVAADRWVVDRMHKAGLAVIVYTLNTRSGWSSALELGVDGIVTDRPLHLENWMSSRATR